MNAITKRKVVLYLVAIFLLGVVAGGAVGLSFGRRAVLRPPPPENMAAHITARLTSELDLTQEQVRQIAPLIEREAMDICAVHAGTLERVLEVTRKANRAIEAYLRPEQRQKLAQIEKEWEEKFRRCAPPARGR